ncbi:neuropeptides capa receptor-like [Asterias amurensis]|uniref:neuropeptides capa receptor-like n=1 Tax=Asterias amurensis TaxID=7602 RepID=UPI003AB4366E
MANSQQQVCDIAMNITTMEEVYEALNDAGDRFAIYIIYPFLMILGIITNGAFCVVLAWVPRMRTITNTYLVNLAVADLTFLIVAVSEKLFNNWVSPIPADKTHIGLPGCIVIPFILNCTYFTSIFTITLVSVEKFYAICRPLEHRKFSGKKRTMKLIVGAWILSAIISCCFIPGRARLEVVCMNWPEKAPKLPSKVTYCLAIRVWKGFEHVANFLQTIPFFIAMVVNTILYTQILRTMHRRVGARSQLAEARLVQMRNQVATMLVANGIVFFICQMLFQALSISLSFRHLKEPLLADWQVQKALVARIFSYANSAVNSIVYNIFSSRYRQAFKETFCWRKQRKILPMLELELTRQTR